MEPEAENASDRPARLGRVSWVWDYDLDEAQFRQILSGELRLGRLGQTWAVLRLLEYAPYSEIVRLLGFRKLVSGWQEWRGHLRSTSRIRGLDFLVDWLPGHRSDLLEPGVDG